MIKETLFIAAMILMPGSIPAKIILALPVDVAINTATGGTPGKTISGDTARARTKGDKAAVIKCDLYGVVAPYDWAVLREFDGDHCSRWERFEARKFDGTDWDGLNK